MCPGRFIFLSFFSFSFWKITHNYELIVVIIIWGWPHVTSCWALDMAWSRESGSDRWQTAQVAELAMLQGWLWRSQWMGIEGRCASRLVNGDTPKLAIVENLSSITWVQKEGTKFPSVPCKKEGKQQYVCYRTNRVWWAKGRSKFCPAMHTYVLSAGSGT